MKKFFWIAEMLLFVIFGLVASSGKAQLLYPSGNSLGLQSATLENIMVLQQLRNTDLPCVGRNAWALGYGLGGYSRGDVLYEYGDSEAFLDPTFDPSLVGVTFLEPTDYDQSLGGTIIGTDMNLGASSRLGMFFAYNSSSQQLAGAQQGESLNVNNYFWGLYGRKEEESFYLMGAGAIGHARMDEQFHTALGPYTWDYETKSNAWRALLYGEIGTEMNFGKLNVQPFWGVQYYYAGNGSTTDTSGTVYEVTRTFPALKTNSFRNVLGIRLADTFWAAEDRALQVNCLAFWYHEFLSMKNWGGGDFGYQPEGMPTMDYFYYSAQNSGRDWAVIAPTVEWKVGNLRLWAGYIALFNTREALQLGQGGIAYCF